MKANKKFVEGEEAVSAVIGVILMVAITVAIAATVYVYVSGMIGTSPETAPSIQFTQDKSGGTLQVATADPNDLNWGDLECTLSPAATYTDADMTGWGTTTQSVDAGDTLTFTVVSTDLSISIRHKATNTLIGSWTFAGV